MAFAVQEAAAPLAKAGALNALAEAVERLVVALLTGDSPAAASVVRGARKTGMGIESVFVDLVQPALYEIGRRWEEGRISAAQEHLASALVARLRSRWPTDTTWITVTRASLTA